MKSFFLSLVTLTISVSAHASAPAKNSWSIDTRVSSQVGFYFDRDGSPAKEPSVHAPWVNVLPLPAGALTGNGVDLPQALPNDIAQIDFYNPTRWLAKRLRLEKVFQRQLSLYAFPKNIGKKVADVKQAHLILKEVRLRDQAAPALSPILSSVSAAPLKAAKAVAYVTIFLKDTDLTDGLTALEAFGRDVAETSPKYVVGPIAELPPVAHPENGTITLKRLMTLRTTDPQTLKKSILEVIEIQ